MQSGPSVSWTREWDGRKRLEGVMVGEGPRGSPSGAHSFRSLAPGTECQRAESKIDMRVSAVWRAILSPGAATCVPEGQVA